MYIKNRRNSSKFKGFGSYQTLCLTESFVLRSRLLFIYINVVHNAEKRTNIENRTIKASRINSTFVFFSNAKANAEKNKRAILANARH